MALSAIRYILPKQNAFISVIFGKKFSISSPLAVKEIRINNELPEKLVISGVTVPSPRENHLLPLVKEKKVCPQCDLGLDIKHTDVLILSQYLRSDGCMLPRRVTGLCAKQQKRIGTMVTMAQKAGLMPNIAPAWSKKDPKRRYQWKKFNKYFFESTIRA